MRNFPLILLLAIVFCFPACLTIPNPDPVDNNAFDYGEFCTDLDGGNFTVNIDGQNWTTSCVQGTYTETTTDNYSQKILYLYAYNGEGTYFTGSDIEMAWVIWTEVVSDGVTEVSKQAVFYDGFFNYQQAIGNPNYQPEEFNAYTSDDEDPSNVLEITSTTATKVSGNLAFELTEENTGAKITMTGDFMANIME